MNDLKQVPVKKIDVLNQYEFFRRATGPLQDEISSKTTLVNLDAGSFFYQRADYCRQIILVGNGSIRVYVTGEIGREITLYHVRPGETCPVNIITSMLGMAAPAMAVIEKPSVVVLMPVKYFRDWISEYENFREFLFESFATRMVDIISLIEQKNN